MAGIWGVRRAKLRKLPGMRRAVIALVAAGLSLLVPIALLFYVRHQRSELDRLIENNRLRQIGLAMHLRHSGYDFSVPTGYDIATKEFNQRLSWRVDLLPYLEANGLYQRYRLTDPWDSPSNRPLADYRVRQYLSPFDTPDSTKTRYHIFVGGGAMFEYGKMTRFDDVTDGLSNTIMIAEGREAAPWPQPFDLRYDPTQALPPMGREHANGFWVVMADGSTRFVLKTITEASLRAAITAAKNDAMGADW